MSKDHPDEGWEGDVPESPLAPPARRSPLTRNPVMLTVLIVFALAVVAFVVLLAIR